MEPSRFGFRRITRFALAAPVLLAMVWCFLMQPQPAALLAPLLGPFATWPLGHMECSMATQMPVISGAMLVALLLVGIGRLQATSGFSRSALSFLLLFCVLGWCLLALLSVVNTKS